MGSGSIVVGDSNYLSLLFDGKRLATIGLTKPTTYTLLCETLDPDDAAITFVPSVSGEFYEENDGKGATTITTLVNNVIGTIHIKALDYFNGSLASPKGVLIDNNGIWVTEVNNI
jgi:hypothetical protein